MFLKTQGYSFLTQIYDCVWHLLGSPHQKEQEVVFCEFFGLLSPEELKRKSRQNERPHLTFGVRRRLVIYYSLLRKDMNIVTFVDGRKYLDGGVNLVLYTFFSLQM